MRSSLEIFEKLGVRPGSIIITNFELQKLGTQASIYAALRAEQGSFGGSKYKFKVTFKQCIKVEFHSDVDDLKEMEMWG